MKKYICPHCGRTLFEAAGEGMVAIRCRRCGKYVLIHIGCVPERTGT